MNYVGTNLTETIWLAPFYDERNTHCIELIKASDESVFYVRSCCNDDWIWAFRMDGLSNYEKVKYTIMDVALDCIDMYHLLGELDAIFALRFKDIIADMDDECECDGSCCENCDHRECLN